MPNLIAVRHLLGDTILVEDLRSGEFMSIVIDLDEDLSDEPRNTRSATLRAQNGPARCRRPLRTPRGPYGVTPGRS